MALRRISFSSIALYAFVFVFFITVAAIYRQIVVVNSVVKETTALVQLTISGKADNYRAPLRVYPPFSADESNWISNPWGGRIWVTRNQKAKRVTIYYEGIPKKNCLRLAMNLPRGLFEVVGAGSSKMPYSAFHVASLNSAQIKSLCSAKSTTDGRVNLYFRFTDKE